MLERKNVTANDKKGMTSDKTTEPPRALLTGAPLKMAATYSPTCAVPSALAGLTSLFGMGRGGTPPP